jgi:GntR family transcriptional regulator
MSEAAYVSLAGEFADKIRNGKLQPGTQLPSYAEISKAHGVSDIVVRKAVDLLELQGLVRRVERRGVFVANRTNLIRVSPERQMETAEATFKHESDLDIVIERESSEVPASDELRQAFGLAEGSSVARVVTRASEDGKPVSISETYQPVGVVGITNAVYLEETISLRIPTPSHAAWLGTSTGELVKKVTQKFFTEADETVMISDISYPKDRYDAFVFRMALKDTRRVN